MKEADSVRVVTVVDNNVWKEGLMSNWGISFLEALHDDGKQNVLMDTSGSYQTFFDNASKLGIDSYGFAFLMIEWCDWWMA